MLAPTNSMHKYVHVLSSVKMHIHMSETLKLKGLSFVLLKEQMQHLLPYVIYILTL